MIRKLLSCALGAVLLLGMAAPASAALSTPTYPSTWPVTCPSTFGWMEQTQPSSPTTGMPIDVHINHPLAPGCAVPRSSDVYTVNFYFATYGSVATKAQFWPGTFRLSGTVPAGARAICIAVGNNTRLDCWTVIFPGGLGRLGGSIPTTDIRVNMPVALNPIQVFTGTDNCPPCW